MGLFEFIADMFTLGTIPAYASLACVGVLLFYVIWDMIRGYRQGVLMEIVRLVYVLLAAVTSYVVTNVIWSRALSALDGETVGSFVEKYNLPLPENYVTLLDAFDLQVIEYIFLLPVGVVVMPIIFSALFFIINFIFKLLHKITVNALHIYEGETPLSKIPGLILGIADGLLVASLVLLPVAAISDLSKDAYTVIDESTTARGTEESLAENMYVKYVEPFAENPVLSIIDNCYESLILDKLATFEDGNATLNMRDEFTDFARFAFADIPALKGTDWLALTEDDKAVISDVVVYVSNSQYKSTIIVEFLRCMSLAVGAVEDSATDGKADVITAFFSVFDEIDSDSLPGVLQTFKEFYFIASDSGMLRGFSSGDKTALTDAFTKKDENGTTTLAKMVDVLESNEKTAVLVTTLSKMTITALSGNMGLDENAVTKYNDIKGALNNTITSIDSSKTKDEQIADVSASLAQSFADNGITVESEVLNTMAEDIVEKYADGNELTDDEFNSILLNYYEANKEHLDNSAQ